MFWLSIIFGPQVKCSGSNRMTCQIQCTILKYRWLRNYKVFKTNFVNQSFQNWESTFRYPKQSGERWMEIAHPMHHIPHPSTRRTMALNICVKHLQNVMWCYYIMVSLVGWLCCDVCHSGCCTFENRDRVYIHVSYIHTVCICGTSHLYVIHTYRCYIDYSHRRWRGEERGETGGDGVGSRDVPKRNGNSKSHISAQLSHCTHFEVPNKCSHIIQQQDKRSGQRETGRGWDAVGGVYRVEEERLVRGRGIGGGRWGGERGGGWELAAIYTFTIHVVRMGI